MLVHYFVPFIVSNRYLLFWVSNGHNSVTVQNRTHVYMNFFDHEDLGKHLLQLCPKVVKHPVYIYIYIYINLWKSSNMPFLLSEVTCFTMIFFTSYQLSAVWNSYNTIILSSYLNTVTSYGLVLHNGYKAFELSLLTSVSLHYSSSQTLNNLYMYISLHF